MIFFLQKKSSGKSLVYCDSLKHLDTDAVKKKKGLVLKCATYPLHSAIKSEKIVL